MTDALMLAALVTGFMVNAANRKSSSQLAVAFNILSLFGMIAAAAYFIGKFL